MGSCIDGFMEKIRNAEESIKQNNKEIDEVKVSSETRTKISIDLPYKGNFWEERKRTVNDGRDRSW